jgi:hypothetical protein
MIRVELKGYAEALEVWGRKPVRAAALSSLKKVAAAGVTVLSTEVRGRYNIKKGDLDPRVKVSLPKGADDLVAVITLSGHDLPLAFFSPKQFVANRVITRTKEGTRTTTRKRSAKVEGVQVQVLKGKTTQLKSAFLMNMQVGRSGVGVMQRHGKKRTPTREKGVISIAAMAENSNVSPGIVAKVQEQWDKTFPADLNYQLNVKGKSL